MVRRCAECGPIKAKLLDVAYLPDADVTVRSHRCLSCKRIIITEERTVEAAAMKRTLRDRRPE